MLARDQRAHLYTGIVGRTDHQLFCHRLHSGDEFSITRTVDIDPLSTQAHLPAIVERRTGSARDGGGNVRIFEHDCRILAAQFERNGAHHGGGGTHDMRTSAGFAGKGYPVDAGVRGEEGSGRIDAEAVDEVERPCGKPGLIEYFCHDRRS